MIRYHMAARPSRPGQGARSRFVPRRRPHVLLCLEHPEDGALLGLLLEQNGWSWSVRSVRAWLDSPPRPARLPDVLLLGDWPLRDRALALRARAWLQAADVPLVLLREGNPTNDLPLLLGAAQTLPLFFSLDDLTERLRLAMRGCDAVNCRS